MTTKENVTASEARQSLTSKAFTLAEVLITLVVIGIIAAVTVPVLTTKYQKQQTAIRLKKVYSELTQAVKLSEVEHGNIANWEWGIHTSYDFFKKYMYPFILISERKILENKNNGIRYTRLNGEEETEMLVFRNNGDVITLASGVQIFVSDSYGYSSSDRQKMSRHSIVVDINGDKKPNKFGKDIFFFSICPNGVIAHSHGEKEDYTTKRNRNELRYGTSNYACNKNSNGVWCAALIMHDGWEIKDDYPW